MAGQWAKEDQEQKIRKLDLERRKMREVEEDGDRGGEIGRQFSEDSGIGSNEMIPRRKVAYQDEPEVFEYEKTEQHKSSVNPGSSLRSGSLTPLQFGGPVSGQATLVAEGPPPSLWARRGGGLYPD